MIILVSIECIEMMKSLVIVLMWKKGHVGSTDYGEETYGYVEDGEYVVHKYSNDQELWENEGYYFEGE